MERHILIFKFLSFFTLLVVLPFNVTASVTIYVFDIALTIPNGYQVVPIPNSKDIYIKLIHVDEKKEEMKTVYLSTGNFCDEKNEKEVFKTTNEKIFIADVRDSSSGQVAKRIYSCTNEVLIIDNEQLFLKWKADIERGAKYWEDLRNSD